MKYLNLPSATKAFGDAGTFEGYAAIFGNVDLGGDVIERGAFKEFVKNANGMVTVLYQHNSRDPIGAAQVMQDDKGLLFKGQLVLEVPSGRNAYALMKAQVLNGMSIGYDVLDGGSKMLDSGIRSLRSLKLWEISPVTFGMNELAGIDSVKGAPKFETVRECETWLRDEVGLTNSAAKEFVARFKKAMVRDEPARDESEAKQVLDFLRELKFS